MSSDGPGPQVQARLGYQLKHAFLALEELHATHLADSPVNAYAAKQSNGQFKIVGQVYGTAPYGIAVPKGGKYAPNQPLIDELKGLQ